MSLGGGSVETNENQLNAGAIVLPPSSSLTASKTAVAKTEGLAGKGVTKKKTAPLGNRNDAKKKKAPVPMKPPTAYYPPPPPYMPYAPPMGMPPPPPGKGGQYAPPHPYGYPHPAYAMHHHPYYTYPPPPYPIPAARPTKAATKKTKKTKTVPKTAKQQQPQPVSKKAAALPPPPPPPPPVMCNESMSLKPRAINRPASIANSAALSVTTSNVPPHGNSASAAAPTKVTSAEEAITAYTASDAKDSSTATESSGTITETVDPLWNKQDDDKLKALVDEHGQKNWDIVAKHMQDRSEQSCVDRWQQVLRPQLIKGPWTEDEDRKLMALVKEIGAKRWTHIAGELPGRNGKQCRERWHNHLNPSITKRAWNIDEDRTILECHMSMGNKWAGIAKYLPGR